MDATVPMDDVDDELNVPADACWYKMRRTESTASAALCVQEGVDQVLHERVIRTSFGDGSAKT